MDERQQRGLVIAATAKIQRKGDAWIVPSQSLNGKYTVRRDAAGQSCTCPDHELRQQPCKHIFAVEYVERREMAADGTVTETRAVRVSYTQEWSSYNAAATTEKEHFCRLLRDLTANVPTPPQTGAGNRRLPLSEVVFAAAFKVYSGFSGRRFMTDLRSARDAGLVEHAPHYNSISEAMESEALTPILHQLIEQSSLPLREVEQDFAVDSTGFGTARFYRYYSEKYGHEQLGRAWVKTHACVGTKTNIVTAVVISGMQEHDSPQFAKLVESTAERFTVREVSADKAYSGRDNYALVEHLGATPFIPFRSNAKPDPKSPAWNKMWHWFALNREDFCLHYHKRSNVEAAFSMIKRVFGDSVRAKTPVAQINEVLLKIVCHNIRVLIHEMHELGIEPALMIGRQHPA
ncbi:MAG: IS5 family transposase [Deltaproteobacteria bacterium]|nr:IS5 family transposase [Deltaproteobacteria bacterium]